MQKYATDIFYGNAFAYRKIFSCPVGSILSSGFYFIYLTNEQTVKL